MLESSILEVCLKFTTEELDRLQKLILMSLFQTLSKFCACF